MMSMLPFLPRARTSRSGEPPLLIGLVNNMPDAALCSTERQYQELFTAAARDLPVRLLLFSLPEVPRGDAGRMHIAQHYRDVLALRETQLDGLIVTGLPPRAPLLADEPYWPSLMRLADWAEERTFSTIWSCLAAHAAVLYIDGITRRALPERLSGVYDCVRAVDHPLLADTPPRWRVPHSRYNGVPEDLLLTRGYGILSTSAAAGADIFIKQRKSLFLFLQGHPEYDACALLREYRRDIGAYLAGESEHYPRMPCGYFDTAAVAVLDAFRRRALSRRDADLLASFPFAAVAATLVQRWRRFALRFYANWLAYLVQQRSLARSLPPPNAARCAPEAMAVLREGA